jgi:hypothetical protein
MKFSFTSLCMLRFVRLEYENDDLGCVCLVVRQEELSLVELSLIELS